MKLRSVRLGPRILPIGSNVRGLAVKFTRIGYRRQENFVDADLQPYAKPEKRSKESSKAGAARMKESARHSTGEARHSLFRRHMAAHAPTAFAPCRPGREIHPQDGQCAVPAALNLLPVVSERLAVFHSRAFCVAPYVFR